MKLNINVSGASSNIEQFTTEEKFAAQMTSDIFLVSSEILSEDEAEANAVLDSVASKLESIGLTPSEISILLG